MSSQNDRIYKSIRFADLGINSQTLSSGEIVLSGSNIQIKDSSGTFSLTSGSAPSTSVNVQQFTSNGTWTKPATGNTTMIILIGGGGGGGGGGGAGVSPAGRGAAGGGPGGYTRQLIPTSLLPSTVPVVIGAGGSAGNGGAVATAGGNGTSGGTTYFGNTTVGLSEVQLCATGGTGGLGGTSGGTDRIGRATGGFGTIASGSYTTSPTYAYRLLPGWGGNGAGGCNSSVYPWGSNGTSGTTAIGVLSNSASGSFGGYDGPINAAAGDVSLTNMYVVGGGGGGGGYRSTLNSTAGSVAGGTGGYPGGGGGGGGGRQATSSSGSGASFRGGSPGGAGAAGYALIITW